MITIRIFSLNYSSEDNSMAYQDFECTSWEVSAGLLALFGPSVRYVPLCNIKSFKQVES